jgi:hypothetical protein
LPTAKTNHCVDPSGVSFRILGGRVRVEETDVDLLADDIVAEAKQTSRRGRPPTLRTAAVLWLENFLAGGKKTSREIMAAGQAAGFSKVILNSAAEELGVKKRGKGFGKQKIGYWIAPALNLK